MTEAIGTRQQGVPGSNRTSALDDVEADLTQMIFRGALPTIIVSVIGVVGSTMAVAYRDHDPYLWALAALNLCVGFVRLSVPLAFRASRLSPLSSPAAVRWRERYSRITLVYCCALATTILYEWGRFESGIGRQAELALGIVGVFCICLGINSRIGMRPRDTQACALVLLSALAFCIWRNVPNFWGPTLLLLAFFTYQFFLSCQYQFDIVVEQLRSRQRHRLLSEQDSLTGLANRRRFERTLESLCDANAPFAILYIDLDRFKRVNDTFGHATGDTLLIQAAERLRGTLRPTDLLARLGGDEFAILQVPFLDADSAQAVARRINQVIAEPFLIADKSISIGASVGIRLAPGTRCDPDALLSTADHALYSVKRTGGGGFALAEA